MGMYHGTFKHIAGPSMLVVPCYRVFHIEKKPYDVGSAATKRFQRNPPTTFWPSLPVEYVIAFSRQTNSSEVRCWLTSTQTNRQTDRQTHRQTYRRTTVTLAVHVHRGLMTKGPINQGTNQGTDQQTEQPKQWPTEEHTNKGIDARTDQPKHRSTVWQTSYWPIEPTDGLKNNQVPQWQTYQ